MPIQELTEHHFYAATLDEIDGIAAAASDTERIEAQYELAKKVTPKANHGQGYTNAETFRAIMAGDAHPDNKPEAESNRITKFFAGLEPLRYTAGEPYAFRSGTGGLNYIGMVLPSQHAEYSGESIIYSIRKAAGRSVEQPKHGHRLWGQALLFNWRAGLRYDGVNMGWGFLDIDEVGVIERATDNVTPVVRAGASRFSGLIGMPAIRAHYRDKESRLDRLPECFAQVKERIGELAIVAPGNCDPPVNDR